MITVSSAFSNAEIADIAQVATAVYIFRGNYCSSAAFGATASSSGDDASGNYPASGAIDGDHVEINMGAASSADNGIGLSTWKSAAVPTGGSPVTLTINLGAFRKINYVKLYNYSGDPLTSYKIALGHGIIGAVIGGTPDQTSITGYTGGLDVYDTSNQANPTGDKIVITIYGTTNSSVAQIVEVEAYFKADVTSRCTSIKTGRQRDWKQVNPMAATASLTFDNSDKFFSLNYTPTSAQVTAGYFNSELDVGLTVQVQKGFWCSGIVYTTGYGIGGYGSGPYGGGYYGAIPELINSFVGTIDDIKTSSLSGTCMMTARDGMKALLDETWSTRLKSSIDIGAAIQYVLNICNVSNYEMSVDTTGLTIPNFFAYESSAYSVVQQLVQAAGSAQFWYDENGLATFKNLLAASTNSHTDFFLSPMNLTAFTRTFFTFGSTFANSGSSLTETAFYSGSSGQVTASAAVSVSTTTLWTFTTSGINAPSDWFGHVIFASVNDGTGGTLTGYGIYLFSNSWSLMKYTGGTYATGVAGGILLTGSFSSTGNDTFTILYDKPNTTFYIYQNSVLMATVVDATYTTFDHFTFALRSGLSTTTMTLSNMQVVNPVLTMGISGGVATYTSAAIDQSANISAEGNLAVGFSPSNAPVTYQTQTSPDGTTWSGWATVTLSSSTQQGAIPSPAQEFIQYRLSYSIGAGIPLWATYYVSVQWSLTTAAGTIRTLSYNSSLCDVEVEKSDSLGGDSSVINYFEVSSSPFLLSGANSNVQWTATTGSPIANVSASNPLVVYTGTISIQAIVSGGMDTSLMSGTNPAAVSITWGTATGSATISYIHPTKPIITLTVTGQGTITNLQIIGQAFSGAANPTLVTAGDSSSQSKYKRRTNQISNNFIPNIAIAQLIANTQLALYKSPPVILNGVELTLTPSVQLTDQLQLTDALLGLTSSQTWKISGINHEISMASGGNPTIKTSIRAVSA